MKYLVLCLTAFLWTVQTLQAQSKKELASMLTRDLDAYKKYTLALNFDSSLQFMPPKMFEIMPRDSLLALIRQAFENEYMTIEVTGFEYRAKDKTKIKKAGVYRWAYVPYDYSMRLLFKGEDGARRLMITMMKGKFGSENVHMESEFVMLLSLKNKRLIAFKDPASPTWSLIEDNRREDGHEGEMQKNLHESMFPKEVLKALKKK